MVLNSRLDDSFYKVILLQFVLLLVHASGFENDKKMVNDFPSFRPGRIYFAIAASPSGQTYSRAFNKTLMNITQSYLTTKAHKDTFNFTLETLVIELPENGSFSATLLRTLCDQFEGKHVVAVLVVGDSPAAFTVSLTAKHAGIPVLWARGHGGFLPGFRSLESSPLEVQLAPTGRELVQALRGLLLQAHWHTFTLLVDPASSTALRRPELWTTLTAQPLHPTLITLTSPLRAQSLFRKLADISRSTRGVVVLLSDRPAAVRILDDARRLNMMDGHFVWLWVDTAANVSISDDGGVQEKAPPPSSEDRSKRSVVKSDISDMHVNYLLKNDQFLLFNRNYGVESSKFKDRNDRSQRLFSAVDDGEVKGELPAGLLSLKPLPVRVDRHLVKGAVRLLIATLKLVLHRSPLWMLQSIAKGQLTTSCWKPLGAREFNFSNNFGSINFEKRIVNAQGFIPEIRKLCEYNLDGKILLFPIKGEGPSTIILKNVTIDVVLPFKLIKKNGKNFLRFSDSTMHFELEHVSYNFENLFNGDKALGDNINKVLNENWKEVFDDVKGDYEKALALVLEGLVNGFFSKISVEEAFD